MIKSSSDKNSRSHHKIGIFDSGLGGLTVMRALTQLLPQEEILYYADTAHLPYGNKSPEAILSYCKQAIDFFATHPIKLLLIACHTACSTALDPLRAYTSIPLIAILEQGIEQLLSHPQNTHIAILSTQATLSSGTYQKHILEKLPHTQLTTIACPRLAPLVEEGLITDPMTHRALQEYLAPLKHKPLDALLLACTHYPHLSAAITHELGPHIPLLDPATACAHTTQRWLADHTLFNPSISAPQHAFYVTHNPEKFQKLGSLLLGSKIEKVEKI